VDKEFLSRHSEGLIALSGCLQGEVNFHLNLDEKDEAVRAAIEYCDIFGRENFFLELMDHGLPDEVRILPKIVSLSAQLGIGLVATNDIHYLDKNDADYHEAVLAIGTKKTLDDPDRMTFGSNEFYMKTEEEMRALFPDHGTAIENTLLIAERVDFKMEMDTLHFPVFETDNGESVEDYLRNHARTGMMERYTEISPELEKRLEYELDMITDMGFAGYYAIVADFIAEARRMDISVGPGRGSGGGSLVAYCTGITDFDPMKYDLLFERFLNPARKTMPDFDIDFTDTRREEVIEYVRKKYGKESVAHIITFNTLKAKQAVKDVGRVLGANFNDMNMLSKLIPDNAKLSDALEQSRELREFVAERGYEKILDYAARLEGLPRQPGMHAAGIVIAPGPVTDYVPLFVSNKDEVMTQYDKDFVEKLGLIKMDFLGLRTLSVIDETKRLVKEDTGDTIDLRKIDERDPKVFSIFTRGETTGVFQFESDGMTRYLMQLAPDCIPDLIAMNALYRPGPMENIPSFIKRKRGEEEIDYFHDDLKPILADTYGIIVYQEQVMLISQKIAGYSLGEADILRRAMGKKKVELMAQQREEFVKKAVERGHKKKFSEDLFNLVDKFAGYGFNKSHAAAYAIIAYQTAWLKCYYPVHFMAANLTSEIGNFTRLGILNEELKKMCIELLPPDVNKSLWRFSVQKNKDGKPAIRFGLGGIKGVGTEFANTLVQNRNEKGDFISFTDFSNRMSGFGMNIKVLESLIHSGALDVMKLTRRTMSEAAKEPFVRAVILVKWRLSAPLCSAAIRAMNYQR
jgi:DNA polymerase-3 subunit alpha